MDYVKLMYLALTKFKDRIRAKLWQAPSVEQEQIIALTAQIDSLVRKKKKTPDESHKKPKKRHDDDDAKFAWKKVPPKDGEPKSKIVNGKTYYHGCPHNIRTIHKPEDCRLSGEEASKPKKKTTVSGAQLEMNRAMQALVDADDLEDDDEDSDEE